MLDKLLYKGGSIPVYSASMASTWVWSPALFVSSSIGYYYGLAGLAIFLIPNILALLVYGWVMNKAVVKYPNSVTFLDILQKTPLRQQNLHLGIGLIVTLCSTIVQLLGMHILLTAWFDVSKFDSCLIISLISLLIVWTKGLKGSIVSDYWKWIITVVCGAILFAVTCVNHEVSFSQIKVFEINDLGYLLTFGIVSSIGLLSAPYCDQTFFQRAFSVEPKDIRKMFNLSAVMFGLIPLFFGLCGVLLATSGVVDYWEISKAFNGGILGILLGCAIFCALLSTLDSNLCAVQSLMVRKFNLNEKQSHFMMVLLLTVASAIMIRFDFTIAQLFLVYGTIRTCMAIPTILVIFDKFNINRLYVGTVCAVVIGAGGYMTLNLLGYSEFAPIATIGALLLPLIGWTNEKKYD